MDDAPADTVYHQPNGWTSADHVSDEALRASLGLAPIEGRTLDPAELIYRPAPEQGSAARAGGIEVSVNRPGEPLIGTLVEAGGTFLAMPFGRAGSLPDRFASREQAGAALAACVPAGALFWRPDAGWVRDTDITDPDLRRTHGLPFVTGEAMRAAELVMLSDIAALGPFDNDAAALAGLSRIVRPWRGQPTVIDVGRIYWLREGAVPDAVSSACPDCAAPADTPCRPTCLDRAITNSLVEPRRDILLTAHAVDERVGWQTATAPPPEHPRTAAAYRRLREAHTTPPIVFTNHALYLGDGHARSVSVLGGYHHQLSAYGATATISRPPEGETVVIDLDAGPDTQLHVRLFGRTLHQPAA